MTEDIFHLGIKALLRNAAGEILLLQVNPEKLHGERRDYWDLPGGRVQKGQTVLETLQREVAEETGITGIDAAKEVGMMLANIRIPLGSDGDTVGLILGVYECTAVHDAVTLSDEHIAYAWCTPQEAAERLTVKYPAHFCALITHL